MSEGDGINGKRLWIRTPDSRWIPAPTGAGEDSVVRSVNVWDGQRWLAVTDAKPIYRAAAVTSRIHALDVYAPGKHWEQGPYNPNYVSASSSAVPWKTMHPNWLRMYQLAPRVDPDWRIVQLYDLYPKTSQSQGPATGGSVLFWPRGGGLVYRHEWVYGSDGQSTDLGTTLTEGIFGGYNPPIDLSGHPYETVVVADIRRQYQYANRGSNLDSQQSFLLDLKTIRQRLTETYPQRDAHFNRQFTPIGQMKLKRIILKGDILAIVTASGANPGGLQDGTFSIVAQVGAPATQITNPTNPDSFIMPVRRPVNLTGSGIILDSCLGYDNIDGSASTGDANVVAASYQKTIERTFESPGEDNIAIYINANPIPANSFDTLGSRVNIGFTLTGCALHYAVDGKDVPDDYRSATDNGYLRYY